MNYKSVIIVIIISVALAALLILTAKSNLPQLSNDKLGKEAVEKLAVDEFKKQYTARITNYPSPNISALDYPKLSAAEVEQVNAELNTYFNDGLNSILNSAYVVNSTKKGDTWSVYVGSSKRSFSDTEIIVNSKENIKIPKIEEAARGFHYLIPSRITDLLQEARKAQAAR